MVAKRLQIIFTNEEFDRLTIQENSNSILQVTVNVHGMQCSQAKIFLNNIINIIQTSFKLTIIHGFNHGTAIKDMLSQNFSNNHITNQYPDLFNKGVTYMLIA